MLTYFTKASQLEKQLFVDFKGLDRLFVSTGILPEKNAELLRNNVAEFFAEENDGANLAYGIMQTRLLWWTQHKSTSFTVELIKSVFEEVDWLKMTAEAVAAAKTLSKRDGLPSMEAVFTHYERNTLGPDVFFYWEFPEGWKHTAKGLRSEWVAETGEET